MQRRVIDLLYARAASLLHARGIAMLARRLCLRVITVQIVSVEWLVPHAVERERHPKMA